jgi:DNA processing protein
MPGDTRQQRLLGVAGLHVASRDTMSGQEGTIGSMQLWNRSETVALVALLRPKPAGISVAQICADVADHGTASAAWHARFASWLFPPPEADVALAQAQKDLSGWEDLATVTAFMDASYPAQLREINQMPPLVFTRGTLLSYESAASIVGSRQASPEALNYATAVAVALAGAGITVVSGLAAGIDTSAHTAALDAGGRTVAVIGTGIDRFYPRENQRLQDRIAKDGLLVSQFWPGTTGPASNFPIRNATMSGFGRATIVVEASENSGTKSQTRAAIRHGRAVILSQQVAKMTNWGKAAQNLPGVKVATGPDHAAELAAEANKIVDPAALVGS